MSMNYNDGGYGGSGGYGAPSSTAGGYAQRHSAGSIRSAGSMQQPAPAGPPYGTPTSTYAASPTGIPRVDRSAQINEYVAKQKAAKANAPLIRKENQRLAEQRVMSASRSKAASEHGSDGGSDYVDDHTHAQMPSEDYRNGVAAASMRPISGARGPAGGLAATMAEPRRNSSGPVRATNIGAPKAVSYESDRDAPSSSGGGGGNNADLQKRVTMLEDQIRLLKQQNRIFLAFMQNTEQQMAELRAAPPAQQSPPQQRSGLAQPSASNAGGGGGGGGAGGYPNNMSQNTKQVLQRSQSERHTQPPTTAAQRAPPAAAGAQAAARNQPPPQQERGTFGTDSGFDQTFAPLDDEAQRERERIRSAKKKAGLLNLREKMAQKQQQQQMQQQQQQPQPSYQSNSYNEYDEPPPQQQQQHGGYGQASARQQAPAHQRVPSGQHRAPPAAATRQPSMAPPAQAPSRHDNEYADDPDERRPAGGHNPDYSFDENGAAGVPPGADEEVETFPCPHCDRRFNREALNKHVAKKLCQAKPRKVFNMAAKRLEDLAQEAREAGIKLPSKPIVVPTGPAGSAPSNAVPAAQVKAEPKKKAKWRIEHEKFMEAIANGKQLSAAIASGAPLSSIPVQLTREEDDDRTPCPHCGRKFASNVADRHIPHCAKTKARPKATSASQARMAAPSTSRKR